MKLTRRAFIGGAVGALVAVHDARLSTEWLAVPATDRVALPCPPWVGLTFIPITERGDGYEITVRGYERVQMQTEVLWEWGPDPVEERVTFAPALEDWPIPVTGWGLFETEKSLPSDGLLAFGSFHPLRVLKGDIFQLDLYLDVM